MLPTALTAADFASYPPEARDLAVANVAVLQRLPLALLPILLRELITYDWKMPAERRQLEGQLAGLARLSPAAFATTVQPFTVLRLSPALEAVDWVATPSAFVEQLTASLWATNQMEAFRVAAEAYNTLLTQAAPARLPARPRLVVAVVGQGVGEPSLALFSKLRPHGVFFNRVQPDGGLEILLQHAEARAQAGSRAPFAHWYIDGGNSRTTSSLTRVTYEALAPVRAALLRRTAETIASGSSGPEALRTLLARLRPEELGLRSEDKADPQSAVLNHFELSLLTEGSGTQIFSTTFVQWAAREALRRAQPETLVLRYAPRQRQRGMDAMLAGAESGGVDPEGSLIDADMGAYYTWLELQRLTGAEEARFLVWFEDHNEAVAIGPGLPRGTTSESPMPVAQLLKLLT